MTEQMPEVDPVEALEIRVIAMERKLKALTEVVAMMAEMEEARHPGAISAMIKERSDRQYTDRG